MLLRLYNVLLSYEFLNISETIFIYNTFINKISAQVLMWYRFTIQNTVLLLKQLFLINYIVKKYELTLMCTIINNI